MEKEMKKGEKWDEEFDEKIVFKHFLWNLIKSQECL